MTTLGNLSEALGLFVGFLLTLLVFSYLLGDNGLFRFAIHIFIGVSAGYVLAVATRDVLVQRLALPLITGSTADRLLLLPPLGLSFLLLAKLSSSRFSALGAPVMALLVGVGAATAIGGALLGTLFPQALATTNLFDSGTWSAGIGFFNGLIVLAGTVLSLAYFQFNVRNPRPVWAMALGTLGQVVIALALGVVFAGVYMAALTALVARLNASVELFRLFFPGG